LRRYYRRLPLRKWENPSDENIRFKIIRSSTGIFADAQQRLVAPPPLLLGGLPCRVTGVAGYLLFSLKQRITSSCGSVSSRLLGRRALRRLRYGGQQVVRVEHVNDGGQAVIGNVKKPDL
jgi:hypothetical protein